MTHHIPLVKLVRLNRKIGQLIDTSRKNGRKLFDELAALFNNSLSLEYLN